LGGLLGGMGLGSIMKDIGEAIPGIDEALAFAELLKSVVAMEYDHGPHAQDAAVPRHD